MNVSLRRFADALKATKKNQSNLQYLKSLLDPIDDPTATKTRQQCEKLIK